MKAFAGTITCLFVAGILIGAAVLADRFLFPGAILARLGLRSRAEPMTCPMVEHADVRSDKPGRCPRCGMDLVPLSQAEHKGTLLADPPAAAAPEPARGHEGHAASTGGGPPTSPGPGGAPAKAESRAPSKVSAAGVDAAPDLYYCPMHPAYTSDRSGDCPICNMSLVQAKADESAAGSGVAGHAAVTVRPERRQRIGVRTGTVEKKPVSSTIRAVGRVEYDERKLSAVSLKFAGWIEELRVKATGESVRKGDPLFTIYSPDVLEAEKSYLLALEALAALAPGSPDSARAFAEQSLRSARERLLNWDLTSGQLKDLEARKEPETRVTILSRVEGVVTKRNVVEGGYAEAGKDLYEIADLSTVWVHADIYAHEIRFASIGQEAEVRLSSLPGELLAGRLAYVYPYLNEATRTVRVRLEVPNPEGKLRPGDYGDVSIAVSLGERLVVDDGAILDSGARQIVFVDRGEGRLEPREVKVAARADGLAVIAEGVEAGETVVTSGNFLIDSESRLKAALLQGAESGMHKH